MPFLRRKRGKWRAIGILEISGNNFEKGKKYLFALIFTLLE
jgi:hypothetical protein